MAAPIHGSFQCKGIRKGMNKVVQRKIFNIGHLQADSLEDS